MKGLKTSDNNVVVFTPYILTLEFGYYSILLAASFEPHSFCSVLTNIDVISSIFEATYTDSFLCLSISLLLTDLFLLLFKY